MLRLCQIHHGCVQEYHIPKIQWFIIHWEWTPANPQELPQPLHTHPAHQSPVFGACHHWESKSKCWRKHKGSIWVCPKTGDIQLWQCWEIRYNPIWPIVQFLIFLLLFGRPTRWHVLKPQSSFGPGYDLNICRESGLWASGGHFRTDIALQISKERLPKEAAFKRNETWNSNDCGVLWYVHGVARFLPKVFDFVVTQKRHGVFEAKQLAQLAVP